MRQFTCPLRLLTELACTLLILLTDAGRFLLLCLRPSPVLAAENLFLRKQLALYRERHVTPRQATNATRMALASPGISPLLALEIQTWTPAASR
jgi:hypothetical protein